MGVALEGRIAELEKEAAKLRAEQKKKADMQMEVLAFQRLQKEQKEQQERLQRAGVRENKKMALQLEDERQERQGVERELSASVQRLRSEVEALRKMNDSLQGKEGDLPSCTSLTVAPRTNSHYSHDVDAPLGNTSNNQGNAIHWPSN